MKLKLSTLVVIIAALFLFYYYAGYSCKPQKQVEPPMKPVEPPMQPVNPPMQPVEPPMQSMEESFAVTPLFIEQEADNNAVTPLF